MTGVELIAAERERQVSGEGWTAAHDDEHRDGELARAAAVYAQPDGHRYYKGITRRADAVPEEWPWASVWWKPSPRKRIAELVKAGALIAAEIDRLRRVEAEDAP